MNEAQIKRIGDLRRSGIGYVRIAQDTGIPVSTVKSYCRRHDMSSEQMKDQTVFPCRCCGKPVKQNHGRKAKLFCSDACRMKYWNSHRELVSHRSVHTFVCPNCGRTFEVYGEPDRKFCSHKCYIEYRFGGEHSGRE